MLNRSRNSRPPSMSEMRIKLGCIVSRHDQMKIAFHELKSQIKTGLLEAEDVFASLAIPLTKLVGLKTDEMVKEGSSSTIIFTADQQHTQSLGKNDIRNEVRSFTDGEVQHRGNCKFEEDYTAKATMVGKELIQKQRLQLGQLVHLLKEIEGQVSCSKNKLSQTIADHQVSSREFFQSAITHVSSINQSNESNDTYIFTLNILKATYDRMRAVLGSVEDGMDNLIHELAERMFEPMVQYVKGLKAEMTTGSCPHLLAMLEEMGRLMRDGKMELEEARKKVREEEQRKIEALQKLKEAEENVREMKGHLGFFLEAKKVPVGHTGHMEDYTAKATMVGKELIQKQREQLGQLVHLLKQIEGQVKFSKDNLSQTIDDHHASSKEFFQRAITHVSSIPQSNQSNNAYIITLNILKATYVRMRAVLGSVEDGVDNLMHELAEHMCSPMVQYVNGLKDEMTNGSCPRLLAMLEEIGELMRNGKMELEEARKEVKVEEQRKIEALQKLNEAEENVREMKDLLGFFVEAKMIPVGRVLQKWLALDKNQTKDKKLLWEVMTKKRKGLTPESPLGPKELWCIDSNGKHFKPTRVGPLRSDRPSITQTSQRLSPQTPHIDSCLTLGSSPSITSQNSFPRKRITP